METMTIINDNNCFNDNDNNYIGENYDTNSDQNNDKNNDNDNKNNKKKLW